MSLTEERLAEVHPEQECPECGDRVSWFAAEPREVQTYAEDQDGTFIQVTDVYTGRYYCHNFGGCELAPS